MIVIGLTGGIGMGKSTVAAVFRRAGVPVFDADAVVHRVQARGGRAVRAISATFPGVMREGAVDRVTLRRLAISHADVLPMLERILHPMVRQEETRFLARARAARAWAAVLDIPLLLETGGDRRVDMVVVVSAPSRVQEYRVRSRRGMTAAETAAMIARQMPDSEKRRRADVVIHTGLSRFHTARAVRWLIQALRHDPRHRIRHRDHRTGAASRPPRYRGRGDRVKE
jgi:dephospho-CoA kinase